MGLVFPTIVATRRQMPAAKYLHSGAEPIWRRTARLHGEVAEWSNAPVLKTGVGASPPWVRIPPSPPIIHDEVNFMLIRPEISSDAQAIDALTEAAFGQRDEADLVTALRQSRNIELSLVAEDKRQIVGHVLFTRLQSPDGCLALGPASVLPSRQRQGIGSRLIEEGLRQFPGRRWRGVFLLGEPEYYARFGFSREAAAGFETPYPADYFMALELVPGGLDQKGPVVYAAPFLALG